jgi:hypothetical protein
MCRAILALDRRFSDVRPRHPRGGPDGGRDLEALYNSQQVAFGAIGFVNQANDSDEQAKQVAKKFKEDAKAAIASGDSPEVFVFLTNVCLTAGQKNALVEFAKRSGFKVCDIMDRERLRIALDSPDGFAIRFQYLALPLSEAEQAAFFAKWGDDINSLISTGFQKLEQKLDRVIFLQEVSEPLDAMVFVFQLNRVYQAEEIGHFRAFTIIFLKEPKLDIFSILFGSSDRSSRMGTVPVQHISQQPPGIRNGISGGQWYSYIRIKGKGNSSAPSRKHSKSRNFEYESVGSSSAIGMDKVEFLPIRHNNDWFLRLTPVLSLADLADASFVPILNASLASKLKAIHIYANGYKISEFAEPDFKIDASKFEPKIPVQFTKEELSDPWVRVRPSSIASSFHISFSRYTPRRLFESPVTSDTLASRRTTNVNKK